jgi:hypothetical protein
LQVECYRRSFGGIIVEPSGRGVAPLRKPFPSVDAQGDETVEEAGCEEVEASDGGNERAAVGGTGHWEGDVGEVGLLFEEVVCVEGAEFKDCHWVCVELEPDGPFDVDS